MTGKHFIFDGQSLRSFIEATDHHPEAMIEFRPMLSKERLVLNRRIRALGDDMKGESEDIINQEVVSRIDFWDLTDDSGELAPINVEVFAKVQPHLAASIANTVIGYNAPVDWPTEGGDSSQKTREELEGN